MRRPFGSGSVIADKRKPGSFFWEFKINGQRYRGRKSSTTREAVEAFMAQRMAEVKKELGIADDNGPAPVAPSLVPSKSSIAVDIILDMAREREQLLRTVTSLQAEIKRLRSYVETLQTGKAA